MYRVINGSESRDPWVARYRRGIIKEWQRLIRVERLGQTRIRWPLIERRARAERAKEMENMKFALSDLDREAHPQNPISTTRPEGGGE